MKVKFHQKKKQSRNSPDQEDKLKFLLKENYGIKYTIPKNCFLDSIPALGKCPNQKTCKYAYLRISCVFWWSRSIGFISAGWHFLNWKCLRLLGLPNYPKKEIIYYMAIGAIINTSTRPGSGIHNKKKSTRFLYRFFFLYIYKKYKI